MQPDSISNLYGWWLGDGLSKEAWLDASNERHLWATNSGSLSINPTGLNGLPTAFLGEDSFFERRESLSSPYSVAIVFKPSPLEKHPFNASSSFLFGDGENGLSTIRGAKTKDFRLGITSGGPVLESSEEVSGSFSVVVAVFDGENSSLHIDGIASSLTGSGLLQESSLRSFVLGHGLFSGEIAEVAFYNKALDSSEISSLSSYFSTRFGLDTSLVAKISSSDTVGKNVSVFSFDGLSSQGTVTSYDWEFIYPDEAPDLFDGTRTVTNSGSSLFFQSEGQEEVYYLKLTVAGGSGVTDSAIQGFRTDENASVLSVAGVSAEGNVSILSEALVGSNVVVGLAKEATISLLSSANTNIVTEVFTAQEAVVASSSIGSSSFDPGRERGGAVNSISSANVLLTTSELEPASTSQTASATLVSSAGVAKRSSLAISSSALSTLSASISKGGTSSSTSTSTVQASGDTSSGSSISATSAGGINALPELVAAGSVSNVSSSSVAATAEVVSGGGSAETKSALLTTSASASISATEDSTDGAQTSDFEGAGL